MKYPHDHNEISHLSSMRRLKIALGIILGIMTAEIIGGILSNSLALLGDAGHMLVDALALGLSLFALALARRPATITRTYGYHRAEIMAALANGTTLILVSIYIFYEAYQRFREPPHINTPLMLTIAAIGLIANIFALMILSKAGHGSLNIRAALWHIIGDTVSSVGVIVAGLIMMFTGWYFVDPIIAIFIGLVILWGAVRIIRESADILLEAVPKHVQIKKVIDTINNVSGVKDVHDMHIWTITSGIHALSAHLMLEDQKISESSEIINAVNHELEEHFNITHTTLQLECEKYGSCPSGFICEIKRP